MGVTSQYRRDAAFQNSTKRMPDWFPVSHQLGDCHCQFDHEFGTSAHQKRVDELYKEDFYTRSNTYVRAHIRFEPKRKVWFGRGLITKKNDDGTVTVSQSGDPNSYTTAAPSSPDWSGGFLSVFVDAAKNIFVPAEDVDLTRVSFWWSILGGPGAAWNRVMFFINPGGPCMPCAKGCCAVIAGTNPWAEGAFSWGRHEDYFVGVPVGVPISISIDIREYNNGRPYRLHKDTIYTFAAINDVGANTGWFGALKGDPPWGKFIKSMYGFVLTGKECGDGGPMNRWQCNNPRCNVAWAMTLETQPAYIQDRLDALEQQAQNNTSQTLANAVATGQGYTFTFA